MNHLYNYVGELLQTQVFGLRSELLYYFKLLFMFPTLLQIQILHSVLHFEKSDNLLSGFLSGFICPVQLDDGTTSIAKNSRNHHGDRVVAAMRRSCDWWNLKVRHHLSWVILEQQHKNHS